MELRQLKYFVKTAETLNFSEAAKQLFVTQSTLSQQIKQLEEELGEALFERSSHNVKLTEAGMAILGNAKQAIYEARLCAERIDDLNRLTSGELNIGVTYSFSPILTETILSFLGKYPGIKLNILYKPMGELMELLHERQVDFVLAFRPTTDDPEIESHILFQNKLTAVVGVHHPLAVKTSVTFNDLAGYDIALPSKGLQARNSLDKVMPEHLKLNVKIELNEVDILLKLVRQSMLVTVLAEATVNNEHSVRAIPLDFAHNEMEGCVHILKDAYRKKSMLEFIRMLEESTAVRLRRNSWL